MYVEHVLGGSPVRRSRWRVGGRGDLCVGGGGDGWRVSGWLKVAEDEEERVGCILAMG